MDGRYHELPTVDSGSTGPDQDREADVLADIEASTVRELPAAEKSP
jgi:hypothetical protein